MSRDADIIANATEAPAGPAPWRDFLAVILVAPAPIVGIWVAMGVEGAGAAGPALFAIGKAWMLLVPLIWWLRVDRRRPSLSPMRRGGLGLGAITGIAISALILGAYALLGDAIIDVDRAREMAAETGLDRPAVYLGLALFWITANSLLEEFVYRWFLLVKAAGMLGGGVAARRAAPAISALLFTIHHVLALRFQFDWTTTLLGSAGVFIGGLLWGWMYLRYRSIWPGYLSHAIVDVAVFAAGWSIIHGG